MAVAKKILAVLASLKGLDIPHKCRSPDCRDTGSVSLYYTCLSALEFPAWSDQIWQLQAILEGLLLFLGPQSKFECLLSLRWKVVVITLKASFGDLSSFGFACDSGFLEAFGQDTGSETCLNRLTLS